MITSLANLNDVETEIIKAKIPDELNNILKKINNTINQESANKNNTVNLKKIRQKVYEKKRACRLFENDFTSKEPNNPSRDDYTSLPLNINLENQVKNNNYYNLNTTSYEKKDSNYNIKQGPIQAKSYYTIKDLINKIYAIHFIIIILIILSTYFCWNNSYPLFREHGVDKAELNSLWFIIIGCIFAVFNSIEKGKKKHIYSALCLLMVLFEGWFIVVGTINAENIISQRNIHQKISNSDDVKIIKSLLAQEKSTLIDRFKKYQDPKSKVFSNDWYKLKYIDPSQKKINELSRKLLNTKEKIFLSESIARKQTLNTTAFFKVGMRLFFAIACFVLIHRIMKVI